jgi:hypothetical protein
LFEPHFRICAKMSKNYSQLTPDWGEGDAALCSPLARVSRVGDLDRFLKRLSVSLI